MSLVPSLLGRAALGGVFAVACIFLACVGAAAVASMSGAQVSVPLIIDVQVEEENGMPAVLFEPHPTGMLIIVAVLAAASAATYFLRKRATTVPSTAAPRA